MRAKKILPAFAAAALSLTSFAHCAHNTAGIGSFLAEKAPQGFVHPSQQQQVAYVYSREQERNLKGSGRFPAIICLSNKPDPVTVTNIVKTGPDFEAQKAAYPDSAVIGSLHPQDAIVLRFMDGRAVEESKIMEKFWLQATSENGDNLASCIRHHHDIRNPVPESPPIIVPLRSIDPITAQNGIIKSLG